MPNLYWLHSHSPVEWTSIKALFYYQSFQWKCWLSINFSEQYCWSIFTRLSSVRA